jgi:hypothetical protein
VSEPNFVSQAWALVAIIYSGVETGEEGSGETIVICRRASRLSELSCNKMTWLNRLESTRKKLK